MSPSPAVESLTALCLARNAQSSATSWLAELRHGATVDFVAHGLPNRKNESWKYTSIDPLAKHSFAATVAHNGANPASAVARPSILEQVPAYRIEVFAHATTAAWSAHPPLPRGVTITAIDSAELSNNASDARQLAHLARVQGHPFVALNTALFDTGVYLTVAPNTVLDKPLHLVYRTDAAATVDASFPRLLLNLGSSAQVTLLESHVGSGAQQHLCAAVAEIVLQRHARLEHVILHESSATEYHIATTSVRQLGESHYQAFVLALGAALTRQELHTELVESGAEVELYGLHLGRDNNQVDAQTTIDHQAGNCRSREHYRSILDGQASSVFNGRVIVQQGANGSDAKQSNHNLLLADAASAYSKPQLEIFADDVKCAHGATVAQLDADAVHYLCSRGIAADEARSMLVLGFADEVIRNIADTDTREAIRDRVRRWLANKEQATCN